MLIDIQALKSTWKVFIRLDQPYLQIRVVTFSSHRCSLRGELNLAGKNHWLLVAEVWYVAHDLCRRQVSNEHESL
jgi:hypothetical protein